VLRHFSLFQNYVAWSPIMMQQDVNA